MNDVAIRVENLSKRYRIGLQEELPDTLLGAMSSWLKAPLANFRDLRKLSHFHDNGRDSPDIIWALKDVSFEVKQGEVVGIIGRNGAGKTTLLKILSRITEPTSGRAIVNGRVSSLLEVGTGFHPELTGRENVYLNGTVLGMTKAEVDRKFDEIVDFSGVEKFIDTPVKRYSSGMQVRLAFSVAAHLEPEILLVDEVLAVGDAEFQKKCLGKMGEVAAGGRTVLFVSHNMGMIQSLCDWGILLDRGVEQTTGDISKVIDQYMNNISLRSNQIESILPVVNDAYEVGIYSYSSEIDRKYDNNASLTIKLTIKSTRRLRNIGVGMALTSSDGITMSFLGPSITNYVIPIINGECQCRFQCDQINRYIAGGEYALSVWLAIRNAEYIVKLDDIDMINIPGLDVFESGILFEAKKHGYIPLPIKFSVNQE